MSGREDVEAALFADAQRWMYEAFTTELHFAQSSDRQRWRRIVGALIRTEDMAARTTIPGWDMRPSGIYLTAAAAIQQLVVHADKQMITEAKENGQ